jgi:hypothetical protein
VAATPPSGLRGRAALEPGDVLAGRYRLQRQVADGTAGTTVWQATDEVLARPVAIKLLVASGRTGGLAAQPFLEAAGRAGALSHPGLARVYDAAIEERPSGRSDRTIDLAYVISEWIDGRTLTDRLLADGPMEPVEAVKLAHDAAEALGAAHAARVGHGRIHPGNVMLSAAGRLWLTDAAVATALHGHPLPPLSPGEVLGGPEISRDTRDLAAVLYAMLTARWPAGSTPQPAEGLTPAPQPTGAGLYAPRQVRAGIPRSLDTVVVRALDPGREPGRNPLVTPRALSQALDEAGPDLRAPAAPAPAVRRRRSARRILRWTPKLIALLLVVAVGITGYSLGRRVGQLPRRPGALDALAQPTTSPAASGPRTSRINLATSPVVVRDYDPFGRDGAEQSSTVPDAFDGDPTTAWMTDGYSTAAFGGLKPGVGLLVDLGRPTAVASVQVGLVAPGASVQLRRADSVGDNADAFTTVATQQDAKQVTTLVPATAQPARYWLIWLTSLPKGKGDRYRDGVAELVFNRQTA